MTETAQLAALERTLVGAAARQAVRRRYRRRLIVGLAVAAPLLLAVAGSVASTHGLFGRGVDQQFSALRDDRLITLAPPSDDLSDALGALPRDRASRRSWVISGQRITGYTTPRGRFCFLFGPLTGGCVQPGELSPPTPVSYSMDFGPTTFRIYGLAYDGVTGISLRARGLTRPVHVVRNALYLSERSFAGGPEFNGTLIVHLRGGAVTRMRVHIAGGHRPTGKVLPLLPGVMPAGNTAT
jgi:hypothetical protein